MKIALRTILILFAINQGLVKSQNITDNSLSLSNNYRIYPSEATQTEVFITLSPIDEDIIFSSCNTLSFIPFFLSEGVYVSTNGGAQWSGNDTCTGSPITLHGGDPGIAIDKNGRFVLTRLGGSPIIGLYSHFSYDNGRSWTSQSAISNDFLERASVVSDINENSQFFGRTYASWVKFSSPFPVMLSYVDSESEQWSAPVQVNNPTSRCAGGDNAVNTDGIITTCWAGVTNVSPFREIFVGVASSSDGGENWNVNENAFSVNGITGILPEKGNIRVNGLPNIAIDNSGGERNGHIYIVTGQKNKLPAGSDPDIILNRSTDGGLTWSNGIRVNQDELNNGKVQYFPNIHVDMYGCINVIFYDDRNTTSDSTGVFLARSDDGGLSWKEFEISDHNFKPTPIGALGQGYQGDNIDISSSSEKLWPVWMDNSTGHYQIWTSPISFSDISNISVHETNIGLEQNSPNPFREFTSLSYNISKKQLINLSIYNSTGKQIKTIVNEFQLPGKHNIVVNKSDLGNRSGLYYLVLRTNTNYDVKKIILVD